jgi:hypothetical protein
MRASVRVSLALVCFLSGFLAAQQPDQVVAEHALGPQWKQLSRRAGMVFTGIVVTGTLPADTVLTGVSDGVTSGPVSAARLTFRVDEAIAGVETGQVLTIREWSGASSTNRPLRTGERILIFLYPLSRLGLTSPIGGSQGVFGLDATGANLSPPGQGIRPATLQNLAPSTWRRPAATGNVSVIQIERAIRSARAERE